MHLANPVTIAVLVAAGVIVVAAIGLAFRTVLDVRAERHAWQQDRRNAADTFDKVSRMREDTTGVRLGLDGEADDTGAMRKHY